MRGFGLKSGHIVLAIPDSGLFVKDGEIVSGHGTDMKFSEAVLFSRMADARKHADRCAVAWKDGDKNGHQWQFVIVSTLVGEKP